VAGTGKEIISKLIQAKFTRRLLIYHV